MLDKARSICQFDFADERTLSEALIMAGVLPGLPEGNKRIALIGDHVLALVVRMHSYDCGHMIGDSTNYLKSVVNNNFLGAIGIRKGLHKCVVKNPANPGPISTYQMATTIEALIGVAYMEQGVAGAESVIKSLGILE
ncbi:hypothetical protein MBLNU457_5426t1 [Dothideomycetes sp. NU457]